MITISCFKNPQNQSPDKQQVQEHFPVSIPLFAYIMNFLDFNHYSQINFHCSLPQFLGYLESWYFCVIKYIINLEDKKIMKIYVQSMTGKYYPEFE